MSTVRSVRITTSWLGEQIAQRVSALRGQEPFLTQGRVNYQRQHQGNRLLMASLEARWRLGLGRRFQRRCRESAVKHTTGARSSHVENVACPWTAEKHRVQRSVEFGVQDLRSRMRLSRRRIPKPRRRAGATALTAEARGCRARGFQRRNPVQGSKGDHRVAGAWDPCAAVDGAGQRTRVVGGP